MMKDIVDIIVLSVMFIIFFWPVFYAVWGWWVLRKIENAYIRILSRSILSWLAFYYCVFIVGLQHDLHRDPKVLFLSLAVTFIGASLACAVQWVKRKRQSAANPY